ncbi:Winged helix-like DNA-binding domain superfamily [Sesbania bispinosa]|nr:Winged helix-like DNA-binding domain superfamily [Sesbania bispinosa]
MGSSLDDSSITGVMNKEEKEEFVGQIEIWKYMLCFTDSFALKCAVELRIADIIDRYGKPLSLSQIAANIEDAPSPEVSMLQRILTVMVRRKIFSAEKSESGETLYGMTHASKWILRDTKMTLAPLVLLENHPIHLNPAHYISDCVREGYKNGTPFFRCHGHDQFELTGVDADFNRLFNEGQVCTARIVSKAVISGYKDGFKQIESLVDVGGGIGGSLFEIVRAYPHIKGINFDLPHVVATAPKYDGITHVGDPEGNEPFTDAGIAFDMLLLAHNAGGKERTAENWKILFKDAGFARYNIIKINAMPSIIEAFPI